MLKFAIDRSARRVDDDGRLHVDRSHISKADVNPYYGSEIPGWEELGLAADKVYQLYRDPVELEKGADSFARIPILSDHVPINVVDPKKELVVGAIGSKISFNNPYLDADLCFWDEKAIAGIETKKIKELSCAYRYVPVMEPGEVDGKAFDGRMTEIKGNHLALVEVGRAGSDVVVADANPFTKETAMKMTKLGRALFAALSAASPALAADSALPALVGPATRKNFNKDYVHGKLMALDATLNPQQLDNVIDALLDVEEEPEAMEPTKPMEAEDESPAEKIRALLSGKVDEDLIEAVCALVPGPAAEDEEPGMKKEEVTAAMDSLRKELREAEEARRDVRAVVGDVNGVETAADVYGFALDHMGVDRKDVDGAPALRALFRVASTKSAPAVPKIAQDSAGLDEKFPAAARFGV